MPRNIGFNTIGQRCEFIKGNSNRILRFVEKDFNREQILRENRKMAADGIDLKMNWLAGCSDETAEDSNQAVEARNGKKSTLPAVFGGKKQNVPEMVTIWTLG